jgi:hypothetical protein
VTEEYVFGVVTSRSSETCVPPKRRALSELHCITTLKTIIFDVSTDEVQVQILHGQDETRTQLHDVGDNYLES